MNQNSIVPVLPRIAHTVNALQIVLQTWVNACDKTWAAHDPGESTTTAIDFPAEGREWIARVLEASSERLVKMLDDDAAWAHSNAAESAHLGALIAQKDAAEATATSHRNANKPHRLLSPKILRVPGGWLAIYQDEPQSTMIVGKGSSVQAAYADFDARFIESISAAQAEQEIAAEKDAARTPVRKPRKKKA